GATYYWGGRTTVNGVAKDNELNNSRFGLTVAVPINRYYSVKFNVSSGISTRTGTDFNTAGLVLQYRWGAGL
ncbi:MAG TPA: transporter, partial [Rhizobacter sp.]|nr:transporter [Rhizobacter sp.]